MNFEDERYVRLYTRDTTTWTFLRWEGQAVFALLLRKVDRVGVFDLSGTDPVEGVTAMLGMPEEIVRAGLERLLKHKVLEHGRDCLIVPRFLEAQEASMSPNARQKESRLRRRDEIRAGLDPNARATVIYFIQSEHGGPIKIGRAEDLARRLVGMQVSRPDKLVVLAHAPGTVADERALHQRFAFCREKGEWFRPVPELMSLVREVAERGSMPVTVTPREESHDVTGHEPSGVTPSLAVPSLAKPNQEHPSGVGRVRAPEAEKSNPKRERSARWRKVPSTWAPSGEHQTLAESLRVDFEAEVAKFRDHEFKDPKSDADAAFRNWLRRAPAARTANQLGLVPTARPRPVDASEANINRQLERVRQLELEEARRKAQ